MVHQRLSDILLQEYFGSLIPVQQVGRQPRLALPFVISCVLLLMAQLNAILEGFLTECLIFTMTHNS